jgi:hypothetical protein
VAGIRPAVHRKVPHAVVAQNIPRGFSHWDLLAWRDTASARRVASSGGRRPLPVTAPEALVNLARRLMLCVPSGGEGSTASRF